MKDDVEKILSDVEKNIKNIFVDDEYKTSVEKYSEFLKSISNLSKYSVNNIIGLTTQMRGVSYVNTYLGFQKEGRSVVKGEKSLKILAPMIFKSETKDKKTGEIKEEEYLRFKAVSVFDITQTKVIDKEKAKILPEIIRSSDKAIEDKDTILQTLEKVSGIKFKITDDIAERTNGYFKHGENIENEIVIKKGLTDAETVSVAVHETAHSLLHEKSTLDKRTKEVQAESVAIVVCNALNIDKQLSNSSMNYIKMYSSEDYKELHKSMTVIVDTSRKVLSELDKVLELGLNLNKDISNEKNIIKEKDTKTDKKSIKDRIDEKQNKKTTTQNQKDQSLRR